MIIPKRATTAPILIGIGALLAFQGLCWITLGDPLYGAFAFYITLGGFAASTMAHLTALLAEHYDQSLNAHTSRIIQEITANRRIILTRVDDLESTRIATLIETHRGRPDDEPPSPRPRLRRVQ